FSHRHMCSFLFPFTQGAALSAFLENATPIEKEYKEEGTWILARVNKRQREEFREYICHEIN
ncbi:MAG TPA: hypothetical protein VFD08_00350, partial [Clostridia bacterium]|nr:hypothetical protein [Clostridia bacterium]